MTFDTFFKKWSEGLDAEDAVDMKDDLSTIGNIWINVEDRLPDHSNSVLTRTPSVNTSEPYFYVVSFYTEWESPHTGESSFDWWGNIKPTHWMEIIKDTEE